MALRKKKKKRSGGFEYQENDPSITKQHAERTGDYDNPIKSKTSETLEGEQIVQFKPKEGKNRIRILPRTWSNDEGPKHWGFSLFLHYQIGPDNAAYPCWDKMGKGKCAICEERKSLGDEDQEASKELRAKDTTLVWIIDRNDEDAGPKIWRMPASKVESPICELSRDDQSGEMLKIDNEEKGFDITFTRKGTKRQTDYTAVAVARKSSYLSGDEQEQGDWLDFIMRHPLPECINYFDPEYIESVFGGAGSDEDDPPPHRSRTRHDDEEEEEDDEPPPRSRRRARDEEEIDNEEEELDEGEEEPEEEEEEEEEPSGRRRGRRSRSEDRGSRLRKQVGSGLKKRKRSRS